MSNTATLPTRSGFTQGIAPAASSVAPAAGSHRAAAAPTLQSRPCPAGTIPARGTAGPARRERARSHPLRLTRRGRVLVLLVLIALLCAAFMVGRTASRAAEPAGPLAAVQGMASSPITTRTVVDPGETLWSIARRIAPARDPREVVAQLRRLNDLATGGLQAGQQLVLPAVL